MINLLKVITTLNTSSNLYASNKEEDECVLRRKEVSKKSERADKHYALSKTDCTLLQA